MDTPIGNEGSLNGATAVDLIGPPSSGAQIVVPANGVSVYNADTVAHDITFQKNKNGSLYIFWKEAAVPAGTHVVLPKKVVLDADDEKLQAFTDGAASTTEPTFDSTAMETS